MSVRRTAILRIAPFAGACCLAWIAVPIGSTVVWWEYFVSMGIAFAAGGLAMVALVDNRYPGLAIVPSSLLLLLGVGLLRNSGGGISSGAGALAILPVFQTALYSRSRNNLFLVLVAVTLFYLVPIWVVGPPNYPDTQYRTVLLAVAVDGIIGLTTQGLVGRIRNQAHEAHTKEQMLDQVVTVMHTLLDSPHARQDACEAIMSISSATSAVLYEPTGSSDQLVCTATAGIEGELRQALVERRSAAYEAMQTGQPVLITKDVEARVGLIDAWIGGGRPSSLLYQPLVRRDTTLGVLVIGWPSQVRADGPRVTVASLLAHEVAAAISRADAFDDLADAAVTDALTGLPNRRAWEARLRQLRGGNDPLTVAILDLDHFKEFNDTYGHPAGDRLLKETAAAWRDELRAGDFLARVGGEEFGLLLGDHDARAATEIVDRLRSRVTQNRTCSAGIAIRARGETLEAIVDRADAALYLAKADGRDQTKLDDRGWTSRAGADTGSLLR